MTAERLFNAIAARLKSRTEAAGGEFDQSETVDQTLSLLAHSAGRFRVILQWQQERPGGGRGAREMTVLVIVQMGTGVPSVEPGELLSVQRLSALHTSTADDAEITADNASASLNNASLMHRCSQVCGWMQALCFPTHDDVAQTWPVMQPGRYYWLNDKSIPTVQRAHEFTISFAQDMVTLEPAVIP
ncbi:MAG: hypothetical protein HS117_19410 [Verrucomicrobiaceae bacterium]|nr:hypothetical protein [Verrucomicrobiaceae bacterium]